MTRESVSFLTRPVLYLSASRFSSTLGDEKISFVGHLSTVADHDNEKSDANADAVECGVVGL